MAEDCADQSTKIRAHGEAWVLGQVLTSRGGGREPSWCRGWPQVGNTPGHGCTCCASPGRVFLQTDGKPGHSTSAGLGVRERGWEALD